jgi:membrane-associated protease RseP (regulator of RpoE activity)
MNSRFDPATGFFIDVRPRTFPWLNVILFLGTCLSTMIVGAVLMADFRGNDPAAAFGNLWTHPATLLNGLSFCVAIMSILFAHEMGHYLTCRYYGINASLPYFIPFPNPVGTMGAFIKIRSPIYDRGSLLEVGVAGPIAGFVVAVFALVVSMGQSRFVGIVALEDGFTLGEPLIFKAVEYLMGMTPPEGMDSYIHPVGFAAWFGFLATALNLLPAAQLDGGHITYAMFRVYHKWISWGVVLTLLPLAIFYWAGWFVWIILLLLIKLRHPPTIDDGIPLRPRQVVLGVIGFVLLILCFTPAPFIL